MVTLTAWHNADKFAHAHALNTANQHSFYFKKYVIAGQSTLYFHKYVFDDFFGAVCFTSSSESNLASFKLKEIQPIKYLYFNNDVVPVLLSVIHSIPVANVPK